MAKGKTIWDELAEPFPPDSIHWRIGARTKNKERGMVLAYIDARDVFDRLDEVVGPANWQTHIQMGPDGRCVCAMEIRDPESSTWITKSDGAGATNVEGEKGSVSDAIKRAFVQFGGCRYLYRLDSPWVRLVDEGKKIAPEAFAELLVYLESGVKPGKGQEGKAAPKSAPRASRDAKAETKPPPASENSDTKVDKEDLKPYWKLAFQAVEAVYGKQGSEEHKWEAMDYAVARLGKNHTNQIRKGNLVQLPDLFKEFVAQRTSDAAAGVPNTASNEQEPPPPEDEYEGNMAPDDEPF